MARTDAHSPAWVEDFHATTVDHDHREGRCQMADPGTRWWRRAGHVCPRQTEVSYTCTKAEPVFEYRRDGKQCWRRRPVYGEGLWVVTWEVTQCLGHTKRVYDKTIACEACDTPMPTCEVEVPWQELRKHYRRSAGEKGWGDQIEYCTPKSRRMATKRAERQAIREGLREYLDNATEVL